MRYVVLGAVFAAGIAVQVAAQGTAKDRPRFEVASIKPVQLPAPFDLRILPNRFVGMGVRLSRIITTAYGVPHWRVVDQPRWVDEEYFNIQATNAEPATRDQMLAMLRTLLVERFRLNAQFETRDVDADLLVLADRNGGKGSGLQAVVVDCETNVLKDGSGPGLFPPESRIPCGRSLRSISFSPGAVSVAIDSTSRPSSTKYSGITIERLADDLSGIRGRPTFDRTGLSGQFDIQLDYVANAAAASADRGPSLERAIEEQLGLKLQRGRGRTDFLVVRSVERPTPD